jgi:DNA-binding MarR family transcriptional regulator
MTKTHVAKIWSLNYRLLTSVITGASTEIAALGLDVKEFFVLADIEECPYPAKIAQRLCMPKPTVTVHLKNLEACGFVRREIDAKDLRRHRLILTARGRKAMTSGQVILSDAFGERLTRLSALEREKFKKLLEKLS